jgi:hypothetical protein
MLTTPGGGIFDTQGDLIPVLGVALSIDRHEPEIEQKSGCDGHCLYYIVK